MPSQDCLPVVVGQSNRATGFLGNKYPNDEPETENDYDKLAGLSTREKRDRCIAQFTNEKPSNPLPNFN